MNKTSESMNLFDKYKDYFLKLKFSASACVEKKLRSECVRYVTIESRVKTRDSFEKKCRNPKYGEAFYEIQDKVGIRIIVYTLEELSRVSEIIEHMFKIDYLNSENKIENLETNKLGYLSMHYICSLGEAQLKQYEMTDGFQNCFEVQIRTLFQHAWAQLSHEYDYKFKGKMSKTIQRRLFRLSGLCELMDEQFQVIKSDLIQYSEESLKKFQRNDLEQEINLTTLDHYFSLTKEHWTDEEIEGFRESFLDEIDVIYIRKMGITTMDEFHEIYDNENSTDLMKLIDYYQDTLNLSELIRYLLIMKNPLVYSQKYSYLWPIDESEYEDLIELGLDKDIIKSIIDGYMNT